ncbi:hypothetical protein Kuja_0130 [Vibrio phage vB_VchM_Kuja]|uniref:Sigma factor for late transcription n=1 Tax=Vibrio phage vB_VchM_Kuja TaxID=2686437 RepID=A0A6B9J7K4_9CAUD|nr:hypothetical protein HWC83_gp013 [Vibrio phage vB_VchM_Kuja]QGZ16004.1 hypothetical protein Kuja_0130 [Vibrio phage vB_VchM_Kuja]
MAERDVSRDYYTAEDDIKINAIMVEWVPKRKAAIEKGNLQLAPIPEFVAIKVLEIANHLSRASKWYNAPFKDEMISRGVCETLTYIHGFDPTMIGEKSGKINFFAYVTSALKNYFGHHIEDEAYIRYLKASNYLQFNARDLEGNETHISEFIDNPDEQDNTDIGRDMSERVALYDQRIKAKKERAALRKEKRTAKINKPQKHNFLNNKGK